MVSLVLLVDLVLEVAHVPVLGFRRRGVWSGSTEGGGINQYSPLLLRLMCHWLLWKSRWWCLQSRIPSAVLR